MKMVALSLILACTHSPAIAQISIFPYTTDYMRGLLDDANSTEARATLEARIGVDVQAWDDDLDDIAAISHSGIRDFIMISNGNDWVTENIGVRNVTNAAFGATPGNDSDDDATAIQAAVESLAASGGIVYIPTGVYHLKSTVTIAQHRIHIVGNGYGATEIAFVPGANDVCFQFEKAAGSSIDQCSISGITFWSDDTSYLKTAIHLVDCSYFALRSCGTMFPHWKGTDSIFLDINGRDHLTVTDMLASSDFPIVIGTIDSPHTPSGISIDHSNFNDLYLVGNGNPLVTIETGVLLSQVSFTGRQSWVAGTHGLYWVDTTSAGVSNGLRISNVRSEGVEANTNNLVYIDHNTSLQGFQWMGGQSGGMKGFYFRNVENVFIDSFYYTGTYEVLNVDSTVKRISLANCFWQATSTASMGGQRMIYGTPLNPNTGALPPTAIYDEVANTIDYTLQEADLQFAQTNPYILGGAGADTTLMGISSGAATNSGSNSIWYGANHATLANDWALRAGNTTAIGYDYSAGSFTFDGVSQGGGFVFNNAGVDTDFTIKSNTVDDAFVLDAGADTLDINVPTQIGNDTNNVTIDSEGIVYQGIDTPDLSGNSYTIDADDFTVLIDDDDAQVTGTVVVALPAAATNEGRILNIKKIGSSETVQLDGNSSEEIDEATTYDMLIQYDSVTIQSDGANWWNL